MRIAIVQSNYLPWKGYFDLIRSVDEFVLFDDAQYTRRDWRNRNRIKTAQGPAWLTVPVQTSGRFHSPIKNITVADPDWGKRHWRSILASYANAPHFHAYAGAIEALFHDSRQSNLSLINRRWLEFLCDLLDIRTKLSWSMDYQAQTGRTERLISICQQAGADTYVSGPSARVYLDEGLFRAAGIEVRYFDYAGYPEYEQLFPPFDHYVSVIDLLFNAGPRARQYMLRH
jgi:WbqC-like protein family